MDLEKIIRDAPALLAHATPAGHVQDYLMSDQNATADPLAASVDTDFSHTASADCLDSWTGADKLFRTRLSTCANPDTLMEAYHRWPEREDVRMIVATSPYAPQTDEVNKLQNDRASAEPKAFVQSIAQRFASPDQHAFNKDTHAHLLELFNNSGDFGADMLLRAYTDSVKVDGMDPRDDFNWAFDGPVFKEFLRRLPSKVEAWVVKPAYVQDPVLSVRRMLENMEYGDTAHRMMVADTLGRPRSCASEQDVDVVDAAVEHILGMTPKPNTRNYDWFLDMFADGYVNAETLRDLAWKHGAFNNGSMWSHQLNPGSWVGPMVEEHWAELPPELPEAAVLHASRLMWDRFGDDVDAWRVAVKLSADWDGLFSELLETAESTS